MVKNKDMEELKTGWRRVKLSNIMEIIGGGTPKTSIEEYWNGEIPWLSIKDFGGNIKKVQKTEKTITTKGLKNSSTNLLEKGDLIISSRGTVGEIAQLGKQMAFNQSCYGLRANEYTTNDFLYYLLKNTIFEIKQNTHGSVFNTITRNTFNTIEIELPPLKTQEKIASILSALDDKIEINNEMNKTLEEMAQTLFKRWFIDFNFPNENGEPYKSSGGKMIDSELGEIPEGWEVNSLIDVCTAISSGGTPNTKTREYYGDEINWYSTKELQDKFLLESEKKITQLGLDKSSAKIFPKNSILMAIYAAPTVGRLGILIEESAFNQAAVGLIADEVKVSFEYVYLYLLKERNNLNNLSNGAAQQNLNVSIVKNYKIIVPSKQLNQLFKNIVNSKFSKIKNNQQEIQSLTEIRDTLLPKLMSGEVEV